MTSRNGSRTASAPESVRRARVRALQPARTLSATVGPGGEAARPVEPPALRDSAPAVAPPARRKAAPAPEPLRTFREPDPSAPSSEDWCTIVLALDGNLGRFQVVAVDPGGRRHVVTSSPSFHLPMWSRALGWRQLPSFGAPRHAHDTLAKSLEGSGWRQIETQGRWHDTAFVRPRQDP